MISIMQSIGFNRILSIRANTRCLLQLKENGDLGWGTTILSKVLYKALFVGFCLATNITNAAVVEVSNYGYVTSNPDLTVLQFESGSTGFSTPPDITLSVFTGAVAGWHGAGTLQYFASNNIDPGKFGEQYVGNLSTYPRHTDITALFPGTVNFVGAWMMWAGNLESIRTIDFAVYGTNDQPLFSKQLSAPQAFNEIYYYGVFTDQAISRVVWHPVEDSFFRLDNMSYGTTTSPVPIPASAWLFSSGLLGLFGLRRKTQFIQE